LKIEKVVLAGDLSLACPAFAVFRVTADSDYENIELLHLSHVKTDSKKSLGHRLDQIQVHLQSIFDSYEIDSVVVEKGFSRFATATQQIQRVVGVFVLTLFRNGVRSFDELSPTTVKKAITGSGKASKEELAAALFRYLGDTKYATDDESDACGVAIAYMKKEGWLL